MYLILQSQKKLQEIMDTFLRKRPVNCLQTPQSVRAKSQERNTASGVVLAGIPHKESLNTPNTIGSLGAKPKRKRLFATAKTVAQKKQKLTSAEETCCLVCGKTYDEDWIQCEKCKRWPYEDCRIN
jgi:hypothetical protein